MGRIKKTINKAEVNNRIYDVSKDLIDMVNCEDIRRKYTVEWGCTATNVNWYIKKAYELIEASTQKNVDRLIARQTATLEKIANSSMTNNDRANAIKSIDLINKLSNLYVDKQDITINTNEPITVSFGSGVVMPTTDEDEE